MKKKRPDARQRRIADTPGQPPVERRKSGRNIMREAILALVAGERPAPFHGFKLGFTGKDSANFIWTLRTMAMNKEITKEQNRALLDWYSPGSSAFIDKRETQRARVLTDRRTARRRRNGGV